MEDPLVHPSFIIGLLSPHHHAIFFLFGASLPHTHRHYRIIILVNTAHHQGLLLLSWHVVVFIKIVTARRRDHRHRRSTSLRSSSSSSQHIVASPTIIVVFSLTPFLSSQHIILVIMNAAVSWLLGSAEERAKQSSTSRDPPPPAAQSPNLCDWASEGCNFSNLPLEKCNVMGCDRLLHHICQVSWQDSKGLSPGGCSKFCRWHHPNWREYQSTQVPPAMSAAAGAAAATSAPAGVSLHPFILPYPSPTCVTKPTKPIIC